MSPKTQRIAHHLSANLNQRASLDDLAKLVKLSRSRLCYTFKAEMGISVGQYFKKLRMRKAGELLETTSLSVKEIAGRVGMTDQSHFVRDFKKTHGLTPSQYREKNDALRDS